jgi:uncharacterized surface protein with fasciclin (FAS1) repeats
MLIASLVVLPIAFGCDTTPASETQANLVATASADAQLSTLVGAVQAAGLVDALSGSDQLTVFAPTNEAFAALPAGTVEGLTEEQLRNVLLFHVAAGSVLSTQLSNGQTIGTLLSGETVTVIISGNTVGLDTNGDGQINASVIAADITASNGVLHKIDAVLLP